MRLNASKVVDWNGSIAPAGVTTEKVFIGPDPFGLGGFQVALASSSSPPSRPALRELFTLRRGRTQTQLVVAVEHGATTHLFGPDPQAQPIELPTEQAERHLQSVLAESDVLAATERFAEFRRAHDMTAIAGFTNSGLFATHHITQNVPRRPDWVALNQVGAGMLSARGMQLIEALGFHATPASTGAFLLSTTTSAPRAIAVLLDDTEHFDGKSARFQLSPVAYGLAVAAHQEAPWLVVVRKDQIRLYPGRDGVGVGSNGQAETYFGIDLSTIEATFAGLLPLIFSAEALAPNGSTEQLLKESTRYATELGARLRERIYDDIVPVIAVEVARQLAERAAVRLDADGLATAYRVTLRILFRLLFQAYAEDRGLLPSGRNEGFDANSLKTNAARLLSADEDFGEAATIWFDLMQVWDAIDQGNKHWQIPAYNGGLFSADNGRSPEGALIARLQLPDRVLGPALKHLLIDRNSDGVEGAVDFRSLSVREFGTIYEGLLESSLSLAEQDLTVDTSGSWVAAKDGDTIDAAAGSSYFHTASGERKATGSYFTPKVVVDHLIERSITPALTAHLSRIADYLTRGDAAAAARAFFDFRVADLAMGSGHFLVAAVDKIEALMRTFLTQHAVPGVTEELLRLADVAKDALGTDDVAKSDVDEVSLLRRQIARRCIYGLDINPMAVELARLALWIHTFVPGLPMSNLDHGLISANSLTGIGSIDEAIDALMGLSGTFIATPTPARPALSGLSGGDRLFDNPATLFDDAPAQPRVEHGYAQWLRGRIEANLEEATPILQDVAGASEATKGEVAEAAEALARARSAAEPARRIFDAAVAVRLGEWKAEITRPEHISRLTDSDEPAKIAAPLSPAHMPYLFPEVFLRDEPGFDVLLGNPPWEELMVEEHKFWLRVRPGLLGLSPAKMKDEITRLRAERPEMVAELNELSESVAKTRRTLLKGPYPGLGTGDIDLYQAFAWRYWQLLREGGALAVVMPRSLLNTAGSSLWREAAYAAGDLQVVTLVNNRQWIFPIHPQYSIALIAFVKKSDSTGFIETSGPFFNELDFLSGRDDLGRVAVEALRATKGSTLPQLAGAKSAEVFNIIRMAPRLDEKRADWDFRPMAEFHATNDRSIFDAGPSGTVPVIGGAGFELWRPSTGEVYAYGDMAVIEAALQEKRQRQIRLKSSAFHLQTPAWAVDTNTLPLHHPRIAFRDIARATDTRTSIAALIPPDVALTNKAPYVFRVKGTVEAEAYLLGVLCSIPLDWYARKYVELGMNFHIFNGLPIPVFDPESAIARRVAEVSGRLAAVDARYRDWAAEVGVQAASVKTQAEKDDLIAELDALVSLLYGLTEDQVEHVFATFHRGWAYGARLDAVLGHYRVWKDKA